MATQKRRKARRSFGEISQLSSGRYRARYWGTDGRRYSATVTFLSRVDAEVWLAAEDRRIGSGQWEPPTTTPPTELTFDQYAKTSIGRRRLRPGTEALYQKLLRLAILSTFGTLDLKQITTAQVTAWYTSMAATPTQQANAYGLFKSIMKDAVDEELIDRNPARVKGGTQKRAAHDIEILTIEQLQRYIAALPVARRVPLLLAGWCGLRSGEVRGLRVRDLDLRAGVVHVRQAVVRLRGQLIIQPPKTAAGVRDVAIPPHLLPALRKWMTSQKDRDANALLFPAGDGIRPLNDSVLRDAHYKARKAIRMPKLTIHDLRHTSATMAAQQGATIAELQARIGHTTPNMALRYQHVAANRDKALAARISKMATETDGDGHGLTTMELEPSSASLTGNTRTRSTSHRDLSGTTRRGRRRTAAIRDWAKANGYRPGSRGRLSRMVVKAYDQANQ